MAKLSDYLTVGGPADMIGVGEDTLRFCDRARQLGAHRHQINNLRLYLKRDLDRILA